MSFLTISEYKPAFSPKAKLGVVLAIAAIAIYRGMQEYFEHGLSPTFYLFGGFALIATILEWKHYNKPRQIILKMENGRLEYDHLFTNEKHTVYQSRTQWIQIKSGMIQFFSENSFSTKIPLKSFSEGQIAEILQEIATWNIKTITHEEKGKDILPAC